MGMVAGFLHWKTASKVRQKWRNHVYKRTHYYLREGRGAECKHYPQPDLPEVYLFIMPNNTQTETGSTQIL